MGIFRRKDSPYWWYLDQLKGRVLTGSTNTADRRLAQRIYLEKNHQVAEERHLPGQLGKNTTFFWMCEQYMAKHARVNKRSWRNDEINVAKLKKFLGDVPLAEVQPQTIEGYKASRRDKVKEATINRELALLKVIFSKAVKWGYASHNPVKEVQLFKEEEIPIRILTAEERHKLMEASPDFLKPILLMAMKTGMRQGEMLDLQWKDVDFGSETISIRKTKAKKMRQLPMHPELKRMLEGLPRKSLFVFCTAAGNQHHRNGVVREALEDVRKEIGIPELTFHTLRHNFASELIAKGCDVRTVQAYMGHSSLRMLQRYAHVNKSIWRSSIQLLGKDMGDDEIVSTPGRQ